MGVVALQARESRSSFYRGSILAQDSVGGTLSRHADSPNTTMSPRFASPRERTDTAVYGRG